MRATLDLRHHIPGRTRLGVSLWRTEWDHSHLQQTLAPAGLILERANAAAKSLLVRHDPAWSADQTLVRAWQALLGGSPPPEAKAASRPPKATVRGKKNISISSQAAASLAPISHEEAAAFDIVSLLEKLAIARTGLTQEEAATRLMQYGVNSSPLPPGRSIKEMLSEQLFNLPTSLLVGSAVLSIFTGGLLDAVVTLAVIGINATIGYTSESATERLIHRLSKPIEHEALIIRDGMAHLKLARDAVPGDLIRLAPGSVVPADARVLDARDLTVDESTLTGESLPVQKYSAPQANPSDSVGDRFNILHAGTVVTGGDGEAVIFATGRTTEMARTREMIGTARPPRPEIEVRLDALGSRLALLCLGVSGLVFGVGLLRGEPFALMAKNAIALAVAALPEGLPAIATSTLALGARAMEKDRALVRALPAVESVGGIDTICLDKTGTLTENRMAVVVAETASGDRHDRLEDGTWSAPENGGLRILAEAVSLCNEAQLGESESGSATELALLRFARDIGADPSGLQAKAPIAVLHNRNHQRRYMATAHELDGHPWVMLKGAPDEVLSLAQAIHTEKGPMALSEERKTAILDSNLELAARGLRVLGVAKRKGRLAGEGRPLDPSEEEIVWLGLIALADPIRAEARQALDIFHKAGIRTIMITGDQPATAHSVAQSLDISRTGIINVADGARIASLDEHDLGQVALQTSVFARVSPSDKLRIVNALQKAGRRVAMIGDGVNDGPALRAASVGVALGEKATDVAREVADIVIADNDLRLLARAIARGRATNDNVRAATHFLLATNLSEIMVMLGEALHGVGESETAMELFWLNLVTDILPGIGLSLAEPQGDVMAHPPEPRDRPVLTKEESIRLALDGGGIFAATFAAHLMRLSRVGAGPETRGLTFVTLALSQFAYAWTLRDRSNARTQARKLSEHRLEAMLAGSIGLTALPFLIPALRRTLGVAPMPLKDILIAAGLAGVSYLFAEGRRANLQKPAVEPDPGIAAPLRLLPPERTT